MAIKRKLQKKIVGLAIFYGLIVVGACIFYYYTANPYQKITFMITDFRYASDTGTGYEMVSEDGILYVVAPELQQDFVASDFFYETAYEDEVTAYVKTTHSNENTAIAVYGITCDGKVYLEPPKAMGSWWIFVVIGIFVLTTASIRAVQFSKVKKHQSLWQQRKYVIGLCDNKGSLLFVPCSTTSYLYPNVEMMDCYYETAIDDALESQVESLSLAYGYCYDKLANPSKLELQLKNVYGTRSIKEFLQYQRILYIVKDSQDGMYIRKMKSILPAPEQNVYEIVTEGKHVALDSSPEELVSAILQECA